MNETPQSNGTFPPIPLRLLEELEARFPPRPPRLEDPERTVWFKAGQRALVEFLRSAYDQQSHI